MVALFGRYEYLHELGRGASGRVFAVRDLAEGGAKRAIKVLSSQSGSRLVWEFARLSRIEHEGVARVRELLRLSQSEHAPFRLTAPALLLVEDLAEGKPLSQWTHADTSPAQRELLAIRVALRSAAGLAAIHAAGLVHGDVKPENLLIDESGEHATLVDLGFCEPPGFRERPSGTPRYMAPELLAGLSSPASDVYALGGTLFDWLLGDAPEHISSRAGGVLFVRRLAALREQGSGDFADVLESFLSADPALRPSDGRAAYLALVPLAQQKGVLSRGDPALYAGTAPAGERAARARTLPYVGRSELVSRLEAELDAQGAVLVAGARGAGRSRLAREALRRFTLRRGEASGALPTIVRSLDAVASVRDVPALLWLAPPEHEVASEVEAALRLKAISGGRLSLLIECGPMFVHDALRRVEVGALTRPEFSELLTQLLAPERPTAEVLSGALGASQGMAGRLCELVAEALSAQRELADPRSFVALPGVAEGLSLGAAAEQLGRLFAWAGASLAPEQCRDALGSQRELDAGLAELWARGLLTPGEQGVELTPEAARLLRARSFDQRAEISASLPEPGPSSSGFAWLARGQKQRAEQAFTQAAQELRRGGRVQPALGLLREAVQLVPGEGLRWWLADSERAHANYAEAVAALEPCTSPTARLLRAEVLRLRGDRARAETEAETLVASETTDTDGAVHERAAALLLRLHFDRGELDRARSEGAALCESRDSTAALRAREVCLLVELSLGLPELRAADELVRAASGASNARALSRALSLRAQLLVRHGQLSRALPDATRALELSRQAGEAHEAATYAVNLGLLHMEAGELGLAWARLQEAAFALSRIDRPADLARVLYNLAALALCIGDDPRTAALIDAAERFVTGGDAAVRAFLRMLSGELLLRKGQLEPCAELLERALAELPTELAPVRAVLAARAALAQLACGREGRVEELLASARAACSSDDVSAALELSVAEIRSALARGESAAAETLAERGMQRISAQTPFAERLRFLLAALDAARAAGNEAALRERTLLSRALLEAALSNLSPVQRAGMRARPEYARVLSAAAVPRDLRGAAASDRWRKLVQSARRLFVSAQRSRIASQLVELALELVHAERALLVVYTESGALEVRARAELGPDNARPAVFSRSVVERVWSEGKPLVTIEASRDLRLNAAQSIHALSVRSVLAVPVDGFGEAAVLYLDDRLRAEAFGADDLELLEDLAALTREALRAAQARTRDARRARKAEQEVTALNLALAQAEPTDAKVTPLIGASPALTRVIDSARRVAKSEVSVLVTGESGTGKELLARLIHEESARRAQAFVAESCAALPDTLLESALFGHVRGAFTGADRARRGLFEAADRGTLFLDEVGEMSPALQAKLLRVLQEGELRPLGSERTRHVDVRVIAATRRDLAACVRDGTFREDLFYRLAVVTVELPPLSTRREDIPLLVRHFLQKHQGKHGITAISGAALRAFGERDYPGNVRQLENEVRRALALCEAGRIEVHDLPQDSAERSGADELALHAQLAALSDKLVAEALRRAAGNVTHAAALLGISRFGLQKMLKRSKPSSSQRK